MDDSPAELRTSAVASNGASDRVASDTPSMEVTNPQHGSIPGVQADAHAGGTIGRYVVLEEAGKGGMARVIRAYDPRLHREVALKLLRHAGDADDRARIVREARAMAQLNHPNVVAVFDVDEAVGADGRPFVFVAMEYVAGGTLRQWLETPRTWREVLPVFVSIGRALAAAHAAGLVHRDVKPGNVFVGDDRRIRVGDFGLARAEGGRPESVQPRATNHPSLASGEMSWDQALTHAGTVLGTPAYMAPEQHVADTADARADQYAYCVALWEALHGRRPFVAETLAALRELKRRGPPVVKSSSVPRWLQAVVVRGLSPAPEDRFASMDDLLAALAADPSRRRARWAAVGIAAVALGSAAAWHLVGVARARAACEDEGRRIDEVWNDAARDRTTAALVATGSPLAADTAERVQPLLAEYAASWSQVAIDVCVATEIDRVWPRDMHERAGECLETHREAYAALLDVLAHADDHVVLGAVSAAANLPRLATCDDETQLALRFRTPADPAERAEVAQLRARLSATRWAKLARRVDDAVATGEEVLAQAERLGWAPLVAETRVFLAAAIEDTGDYERARVTAVDAYVEAAQAGASEVAADAAILMIHIVGYRLARLDEALLWSRLAQVELARMGAKDDLDEARWRSQVATVHHRGGHFEEAKAEYEQAFAIRERVLGPEHFALAANLGNLAGVYFAAGDSTTAKAMCERALAVQQRALGPEHPEVAQAFNNLALLNSAIGEHEEAKRLAAHALAILERAHGPEHHDVANTMTNLANAHNDLGEHAEAARLLERALASRERQVGPDHPDVGTILNNLANTHVKLGDDAGAAPLHQRAIEILERQQNDHPDLARVLSNYASIYVRRRDYERAHAIYERALGILERSVGADHPDVALVLTGLGQVALAQRSSTARALLERALAIRERLDVPREDRAETRFALAQALGDDSRARARALAEQAATELRGVEDAQELRADIERWLARR